MYSTFAETVSPSNLMSTYFVISKPVCYDTRLYFHTGTDHIFSPGYSTRLFAVGNSPFQNHLIPTPCKWMAVERLPLMQLITALKGNSLLIAQSSSFSNIRFVFRLAVVDEALRGFQQLKEKLFNHY